MIYGEILKIILFYHFDPDPRFPPFLLYVRWKSGVTFVRRCFRDDKSGVREGKNMIHGGQRECTNHMTQINTGTKMKIKTLRTQIMKEKKIYQEHKI